MLKVPFPFLPFYKGKNWVNYLTNAYGQAPLTVSLAVKNTCCLCLPYWETLVCYAMVSCKREIWI